MPPATSTHPHPRRLRQPFALLAFGLALLTWADETANLLPNSRTLELVRQRHSPQAAERVQRWRQFVERDLFGIHEQAKLERVNRFFNQVPSVTDQANWGQRDYWATPVELLASNGGDCEDYALAKYFTLKAAGVPTERLRITYVRAWIARERRVESHMVLAYYPFPDADPLILDNLNPQIRTASERTDLTPTMGFNADGLWSAKQRGQHGRIGEAANIEHWNRLLARMRQER
jgi:predicted transglutaminase-like cysteine proteinase